MLANMLMLLLLLLLLVVVEEATAALLVLASATGDGRTYCSRPADFSGSVTRKCDHVKQLKSAARVLFYSMRKESKRKI